MNEEEKCAIEDIKEMIELYEDDCLLTTGEDIQYLKIILNLIDKQWKEIHDLELFKEEVIDIIKYADDTAEPTYWNIRKLLGLGDED